MDAPQYVDVGVPLSDFFCWMFYYTHHSDMDAPQYVHVDGPSDYLRQWTPYYTHHSDMDTPEYVHADVPSGMTSNKCFVKHVTAIWMFPTM